MGYRSQVFFMIDSMAPYSKTYQLADKVRAFAANLKRMDPKVQLFDGAPITGGHGLGKTRSNDCTGFLIPWGGWKWYDSYPEPTWLNQLMDFMDSQGLEKYYYFLKMGEGYETDGTMFKDIDNEHIEIRGQLDCHGLTWAPVILYNPNA